MKTYKIADFKVKDLPGLKKAANKVTAQDVNLVREIWISNIERCQENNLHVADMFLKGFPEQGPNTDGLNGCRVFAAFVAPQRKALKKLFKEANMHRGASFEKLCWLRTDETASFTPENVSYTLPIHIMDKLAGTFDLTPNKKKDKITLYKFEGSKRTAKKVKRKISFTSEFWVVEYKLIVPSIHNIPSGVEVFISEKTGRRTSLSGLIAEAGGAPYYGYVWLKQNPGKSLEDAVAESIRQVAAEMKKALDLNFKKTIEKLSKIFDKLPESTIRAVVIRNFEKYGAKFSLEKCETQLKRMESSNKPCVVWDEYADYTLFPSTEMAAEALGYTIGTVQAAISSGKMVGKKFYITRPGVEPSALAPQLLNIEMTKTEVQDYTHLMGYRLPARYFEVYADMRKYRDFDIVAEFYNLKRERVSFMCNQIRDAHKAEVNFAKRYESDTPHEVEFVHTDLKNYSSQIEEQFGVPSSEAGINACPNRGIFAHTDGVTNNADGVASAEESLEDLIAS